MKLNLFLFRDFNLSNLTKSIISFANDSSRKSFIKSFANDLRWKCYMDLTRIFLINLEHFRIDSFTNKVIVNLYNESWLESFANDFTVEDYEHCKLGSFDKKSILNRYKNFKFESFTNDSNVELWNVLEWIRSQMNSFRIDITIHYSNHSRTISL